jgi:hypothetical protein
MKWGVKVWIGFMCNGNELSGSLKMEHLLTAGMTIRIPRRALVRGATCVIVCVVVAVPSDSDSGNSVRMHRCRMVPID